MLDKKPILALETSDKNCSVCLYFDSDKYFEFSFRLKNAHSEKIFELIEKIYHSASVSVKETGSIAVSSGPGSFTGLRIGMSAAKGLAFGLSVPIIPVPTFEAMALQICDVYPDNIQFSIANKVNSEEIYYAKFQIKGNNFIFVKNLSIIKDLDSERSNLTFGNAVNNKSSIVFSAPSAQYIARWAERFGENKITYEFDYLEPDYLKELIIKGTKK